MATRPVSSSSARKKLKTLPGWKIGPRGRSIRVEYRMKNFNAAVRLISRIAVIADKMDHHPDIHLTGYRRLRIELSTHEINALSKKDFILASRIERLPKHLKENA